MSNDYSASNVSPTTKDTRNNDIEPQLASILEIVKELRVGMTKLDEKIDSTTNELKTTIRQLSGKIDDETNHIDESLKLLALSVASETEQLDQTVEQLRREAQKANAENYARIVKSESTVIEAVKEGIVNVSVILEREAKQMETTLQSVNKTQASRDDTLRDAVEALRRDSNAGNAALWASLNGVAAKIGVETDEIDAALKELGAEVETGNENVTRLVEAKNGEVRKAVEELEKQMEGLPNAMTAAFSGELSNALVDAINATAKRGERWG